MALKGPRGAPDYLPPRSQTYEHIMRTGERLFRAYGYLPIFTPAFEHVEVFERGLEEQSDLVTKEMYVFKDRSGRRLALRPEGTASVMRAVLDSKANQEGLPLKYYYTWEMFRYERPQKGRFRALRQLGVEGIGSKEPSIDAEVIEVGRALYSELTLDVKLAVNSIGHPGCRDTYLPRLVEYLESHRDELCEDCRRKITTSPLRTFDCKVPRDREIMADAPVITDSLCRDCKEHFEAVRGLLNEAGIDHRLEPRLVRGLDYYTRTTFVYIAEGLGAQDEVGGGGRYDGLSEALGGEPLPGIGFGLGVDRILMALESKQVSFAEGADAFVVAMGDDAAVEARRLVRELRGSGMRADYDHAARSMKGQLRAADRSGARFTVMIGERELGEGAYTVKEMATGQESKVPVAETAGWLRART